MKILEILVSLIQFVKATYKLYRAIKPKLA
ncbi:hypothetical protein COLU111180_01450 [Cohnella lubricantis]|nr:putative membrane protein [Cohnella lubricantis]